MINETKYKNNEELLLFIAPLTELATQMILAGTLKKNVIKHFTNRGLSYDASENIANIAIFQASEFQTKNYKN